MNINKLLKILDNIENFAVNNDYKGFDPYDGLNTDLIFLKSLKKIKIGRLFLIHLNKRLIYNFRYFLGVSPDINPKTLALFLMGLIKLNRLEKISKILELIIKKRTPLSPNYSWGYYFDWQSRVFYQPAYTPTVVVTSFVCNSLMDLYEITKNKGILDIVENSIQFFTDELNIFENNNGLCFSYSPSDNSIIYNASALGLEILARFQKATNDVGNNLNLILEKGISFLKAEQNYDGSWYYGKRPIQHFIDHYHTAYILESLENIDKYTNYRFDLKPIIKKGLDFYLNNMFFNKNIPKFYKNSIYPIESHCAGAAIKSLCVLSERFGMDLFKKAINIADWTINNLYDNSKGYFYYQKRKFWTNKINYMRWSQAWMYIGLSYLLYYGKKYEYSIY